MINNEIHIFNPRTTGAPAFTPTKLAQHYTSTDGIAYISIGTNSPADWIDISYNSTAIAIIQAQIVVINSTLGSLQTQIDGLQTQIDTINTAITSILATINSLPLTELNAAFTGDVDGVNDTFTITDAFVPGSVMVWSDAGSITEGIDYDLTGNVITITASDSIPHQTLKIIINKA